MKTVVNLMDIKKISEWMFCFEGEYGDGNRQDAIGAYADFIDDALVTEMSMPGHCRILGFVDGREVLTSQIKKIRKLGDKADYPYVDYERTEYGPADLLLVKTKNSYYYLVMDEESGSMPTMLDDYRRRGKLNSEKGAYLPLNLRNTNLL